MQSFQILNSMIESKLAVVVRGDNASEAFETAKACYEGGVRVLEVTFTVPGASQAIEKLKEEYPDTVIGAGTVLDSETARIAILAGAQFIVSPGFNKETAKLCNRYHIPYLPGCMTISEMITATEYGAQVIKLFPGQLYSPDMIKNIKGPLPHLNIMPTGGISLDNINEWLKTGAVMVGVGGEITKGSKTGDYDDVTNTARKFIVQIQEGS